MLALCPPSGHAPLVLAFAGLPGSGKSRLAQMLAQATRWSTLNRDEIRAERSPGDASDEVRAQADQLLLRRVGSGVRAAMNLIVDGRTFARAADRASLLECRECSPGQDCHAPRAEALALPLKRQRRGSWKQPQARRQLASSRWGSRYLE